MQILNGRMIVVFLHCVLFQDSSKVMIFMSNRELYLLFQNIIMYEYLPSLLGEDLTPYSGYKPDVHPGVSHVFQSAAFRFV